MTNDMTKGNPMKLIIAFSIPLLIGNIFQQFYSMVDAIIVGRYVSVDGLAAVGATGSLSFLVIGFVQGIASGFTVLVAQSFGANNEKMVRRSVSVAVYLAVIVTVILTIITVLSARSLLVIMKTPADILDDSTSYITVIFCGIFATMTYNLLSGILRALGDSRTPLYFLIISSLINVVLDLVFIVNFKMGVAGAGVATVVAQLITDILCFIYIKKKFKILKYEKGEFAFDFNIAKREITIGIPMALQFSITAIGSMILQSAINDFGSTVVASYTASSKVEQLALQPMITFGVTMATYTGQNYGANRIDRIKEGVKKCDILAIIVSLVMGTVIYLFCDVFVKLFITSADTEVINDILGYSRQYINTVVLFFIPLSLLFIYRNTLQGLGNGLVPMLAGVAELIARAFVAFILSKSLGYFGICLAGPIAWIAAVVPLMITYTIQIKKLD